MTDKDIKNNESIKNEFCDSTKDVDNNIEEFEQPNDESIKNEFYDSTETEINAGMKRESVPQEEKNETEKSKVRALKISCHKCLQKLDLSNLEPFSRFNCPACNIELIVPKWFDNYLLEEPGGLGGMATVYRALDLALDREVAIKVLNPDVASKKERSELFLHEARTAATINHYAVVPIYTCGEYEEHPYIVMQYMNGDSLEHKLDKARDYLPIKDTLKWIRDIAEGLDNARRHGIIHHDIKPGNIMLDSEGNAKIGDFGIAQALNDSRTKKIFEITKSWVSPHYVSPEKITGGKEDYRGDIYSLGASFYHIITSTTPFISSDVNDLIRARLLKMPVAPNERRPEIPEEVSNLIMSMMNIQPENRPSYKDIIKSLNSVLKNYDKLVQASEQTFINSKTITVPKSAIARERSANAPISSMSIAVKKRKIKTLSLIVLIIILITVTAGIIAGLLLSGVLGTDNSSEFKDYVPEATKLFASGDAGKALATAKKVFDSPTAGMEQRQQAALQMALADFFNLEPNARENCSFICERLIASNVSENSSYIAIIRFLEKPDISPDTLMLRLEDEKHLAAMVKLVIFLRNIYDKASPAVVLASLSAYADSLERSPENYWGNVWKKRVDVWAKYLKNGQGSPVSIENAIKSNKADSAKK